MSDDNQLLGSLHCGCVMHKHMLLHMHGELMKSIVLILTFMLLALPAIAANTTPSGVNGQIQFNLNGQFGPLSLSSGLYIVSCPNGQYFLSLTSSIVCPPLTGGIVTPLNVQWVTPLGANIVTP